MSASHPTFRCQLHIQLSDVHFKSNFLMSTPIQFSNVNSNPTFRCQLQSNLTFIGPLHIQLSDINSNPFFRCPLHIQLSDVSFTSNFHMSASHPTF
ncbi:hypothetical protein BgiBS90_018881 [Biomphalaria glabrata]|nr:hypothetical protein BgiBS90_018881 [Biomphalaria glabrata]